MPVRRGGGSRWWSSWRRSCRIHSVLRGKVGSGGSPSRPVPPPIHVSLICFPVSAASPLTSPSRVRGGVWLLVGRGRRAWPWWRWWWCSAAWVQHPLISHPLARQHQNKATITNSFTLWGVSGYQPRRDSLGKIKGKQNITNSELWILVVVWFMLVLFFFFCRSHDATTKQWHVCTIHINIVSVYYSCFCRVRGAMFCSARSFFFLSVFLVF